MEYAALTDVGMKRRNNEDAYIINESHNDKIFIVADGMGGHNAGEIASLEACRMVEGYILSNEGDIKEVMKEAVRKANKELFIRAAENTTLYGMGTTVDACVVRDDTLYVAHVGDSRVYIVSENEIRKVTKDHSVVGMMVDMGSISEEEARNHPQRNYITRAVGTTITVDVDIEEVRLHSGDWILMCTDGLTTMVTKDVIQKIISESENADCAVKELVRVAKENGGDDNITVVLIRV